MSGYGGAGAKGSGGAGAAIGSNGGLGGAGANRATGARYYGDRVGNDGTNGKDGGASVSVGNFLLSGNVVASLTKGKAQSKKATVTRTKGGEWAITIGVAQLGINGGGGGGYGGLG